MHELEVAVFTGSPELSRHQNKTRVTIFINNPSTASFMCTPGRKPYVSQGNFDNVVN